jgi:hypothetical protein
MVEARLAMTLSRTKKKTQICGLSLTMALIAAKPRIAFG